VYVAQVEDVKFYIIIYVIDLILVCKNKNKFLQVKEELFRKFKTKDLGDLHFFLVESGKGSCTMSSLHQPKWVSQGDFEMLSHGRLQSHLSAT